MTVQTTPQEMLFGKPINQVNRHAVKFDNVYMLNRVGAQAPENLFGAIGIDLPDGTKDPASSINYMMNKRQVIERSAYQRPLVRIADKNMRIVSELTLEVSLEYEELMHDSGPARVVIDASNWMVDYLVNLTMIEEDLHLIIDPFPTQRNWRNRWGGKIHTINIKRNADGTNLVELLAISNREHAKRLLYACNPIFPAEIQLPQMWILPGPTRTVLFISSFINLSRLFLPGLSFITNLFNPFGWFYPSSDDGARSLNPLAWPIQVAYVHPLTDDSKWTVLGATWTSWHDASLDILKDSGCMMRAYTFIADEDIDSPYSDLAELFDSIGESSNAFYTQVSVDSPDAAQQIMSGSGLRPTRNCVVFSFEDHSGQTGPTGTVLDGLLNVIGVTLDDLVSSTLINAQTGLTLDGEPVYDTQNNEFPVFESVLGVAPAPPKVIWRSGTFTAELESTHILNKASPRTCMTGSRSPTLVNEAQTFGIKYGLSQLQDMVNVLLGTFENTAFQLPGTPGLQDIYQGQLDNVLFAWMRITSPLVGVWGGDCDFQEYMERGSGTAWTLSAFVTISAALWKTRAYHGMHVNVLNGYPWTVGVDTFLGDRNGWELSGVIYVDQIHGIKKSVDRKHPLLTGITVGENKDKGDPLARVIRAAQGIYTLLGAVVGQGTIFN